MSKHQVCKGISNLISIILIIAAGSIPAFAKYSGGTGEPNDPYQIASVSDLLTLAEDVNDYNKCFIMTSDIDLDPCLPGNQIFSTAVIAPDSNLSMEYDGIAFSGVFDGKEHKIFNLTIDANGTENDFLAMFGYIGIGGEVKNMGLENISVTYGTLANKIAGLVACSDGNISNCYSTGAVDGNQADCVGGLVGLNNTGIMSNCHSFVIVSGGEHTGDLGGLAGFNKSSITNCFSTGAVTGGYFIGGLTGGNDSNIHNCHSTSAVVGESDYVGGLVGIDFNGTITNCYSTGSINIGNRASDVGGLVGDSWNGTIRNCYSTGTVITKNNSNRIGGLMGRTSGSITNCYSTSHVIFGEGSTGIGGLVGASWHGINGINDNYFLDVAGPDNGYGTPLTDSRMKKQTSFAGWDFINETVNGTNDVWIIFEGFDYPKLAWTSPLSISRCVIRSASTDSISISGLMSATADDFNDANNSTDANFVEIAISSENMTSCVFTVPVDRRTWKNDKFVYSGAEDGIKKLFRYNPRSHKFNFWAKKLDLSGLECPLTIDINVGDYTGTVEVEETKVNGTRPMPIKLLMGVEDAIRVDRTCLRRFSTDWLSVRGGFTVEDTDVNLANVPLSITLDSQTFTIPEGSFRAGNNIFRCSNVIIEGGIASARFNFNKGTFRLIIKNSDITAESGTFDFGMEFDTFNENTQITLP